MSAKSSWYLVSDHGFILPFCFILKAKLDNKEIASCIWITLKYFVIGYAENETKQEDI